MIINLSLITRVGVMDMFSLFTSLFTSLSASPATSQEVIGSFERIFHLSLMGNIGVLLMFGGLGLALFGEGTRRFILVGIFKPVASLGFLLVAFAAPHSLETSYGVGVMIALMLSALGDILLIKQTDRALLMGLGAFLLAHFGYGAACLFTQIDWLCAGSVAAISWVGGGLVYRIFLPHMAPELRVPSALYVFVIGLMMSLTLGKAWFDQDLLLAAAAICFWFSDVSVARARFTAAGFGNRLWGLPLYYLAQLFFAFTLYRAV